MKILIMVMVIMKQTFFRAAGLSVFIAAMVLMYTGCTSPAGSNGESADTQASFTGLTADGSAMATTTRLTLTFDKEITGLAAADIALTSALTKGTLNRTNTGVYELAVSGITAGGQVSVTVAKTGYTVSGNPKTVQVFYYSAPGDIAVSFSGVAANGSATATTTRLTLTFDKDITGLATADIALTPALTKGSLNRTNTGVYELAVSGITAGGQVSVTVAKTGYTVSGNPKTVQVFYYSAQGDIAVSFSGVAANGSATATTNKLTLTFDKNITGLAAADIALNPALAKGALIRTGTGVYELSVSGITASGQVSVTVTKSGYTVSSNPKTAQVFYYSAPGDIAVSFNGVAANGSATATTTRLTLTLDRDIDGLAAADIALMPVLTKGSLSRINTGVYELSVSGITTSGQVSVTVAKTGYNVSGNPKTAQLYYYSAPEDIAVLFNGVAAWESSTMTTTGLWLTFDRDIWDLAAEDIALNPALNKGSLIRYGNGGYLLAVSGITASGQVSVTVAKTGYTFSGNPKTAQIYYVIPAEFTNLEADGFSTATTTKLTLTFDRDIIGLSAEDIALYPALTKGALNRTGTGVYELAVSGINADGQVHVTVSKDGYSFTTTTRYTEVYYYTDVGIGVGNPTVLLYLDGIPLQGERTTITQGTGTITVSIGSGTYTEILWYLNGNIVAQGSARTSIALRKQTTGTYNISVEATTADGGKNTGSHSFVVQ